MDRRRKFWGWGFEDQQPPEAEVAAAAAGAREHLGFAPAEVERPARLEDIELRPPRIEPPGSLAHICATDRYERVTHSYGKAYRDIVRGFRGRFDNPPDVVARPADEADVERVLAWCEEAGAAAIPFGGGTSVVGGVEPPPDRAGACRSTWARSTGCSRWTRSHARRGSRPACSGRRSRTSSASAATRSATSRSRSSTRRSGAGSPLARAGTSRRSTPTSTTSWSRCAR